VAREQRRLAFGALELVQPREGLGRQVGGGDIGRLVVGHIVPVLVRLRTADTGTMGSRYRTTPVPTRRPSISRPCPPPHGCVDRLTSSSADTMPSAREVTRERRASLSARDRARAMPAVGDSISTLARGLRVLSGEAAHPCTC